MSERVTIEIETAGAAFEDAPASEIARILRQLAERLETRGFDAPCAAGLYDYNGNRCGAVTVRKARRSRF